MTALENRHLSDQVYDALRGRIVRGEFAPGERLIEVNLAHEYGVSRTPVKQAVDRLVGEGLVEIVPRKGTFVTEIDANRLREMFAIRRLLETYAAAQGIDLVSPDRLERMRSLLDDFAVLFNDEGEFPYPLYTSKDVEFHTLIVEWSGNQKLLQLYRNLSGHLQIDRVRYLQEHKPHLRSYEEHRLIFRAYEERNSATLVELLDQHIRRAEIELLAIAGAAEHSS